MTLAAEPSQDPQSLTCRPPQGSVSQHLVAASAPKEEGRSWPWVLGVREEAMLAAEPQEEPHEERKGACTAFCLSLLRPA